MSVELFDLVNASDEIIGTTNKEVAHATGQLHRVAAVFVFNHSGDLFVQQHPSDGKWDHSVGGHVSKGESYADAAAREAKEELGVQQPLTEIATSVYADEHPNMQHMFGIYACTVRPEWEFVPNPDDKVEVVFPMSVLAVQQAMQDTPEKFTPGFRITMSEYVRRKALELS